MRYRTIALLASATAAVVVMSCGKEVTETVPVASVEITGLPGPLSIGSDAQLTARPLDNRGNLLNRQVSWASSNQSVATIDQTGKVRGVAGGTATITAATEGISGTA